jgi:hypothetical protein
MVKHQSDCYRTIRGQRWPNLCDILETYHEEEVAARRLAGHRIRLFKHPDGYRQAFIHPDDLVRYDW